jgi:hypothetical protein
MDVGDWLTEQGYTAMDFQTFEKAVEIVTAAIAQDREEREEVGRCPICLAKIKYPPGPDPLSAKLERLAVGILPEHQHWIWDKEKYYLKVVSVFQAENAKYRKNRKQPKAALDAALEEAGD